MVVSAAGNLDWTPWHSGRMVISAHDQQRHTPNLQADPAIDRMWWMGIRPRYGCIRPNGDACDLPRHGSSVQYRTHRPATVCTFPSTIESSASDMLLHCNDTRYKRKYNIIQWCWLLLECLDCSYSKYFSLKSVEPPSTCVCTSVGGVTSVYPRS